MNKSYSAAYNAGLVSRVYAMIGLYINGSYIADSIQARTEARDIVRRRTRKGKQPDNNNSDHGRPARK
jgi:hypothetical protein